MRRGTLGKKKAWKKTRIRISFQYKLPGILLGSGQLPCHAVFFCCPQKSACLFPFSLLSPVVSNQSTFPGLCRTDCTFVILPCICVSEVSMLMFLLLVRKRMYSRNKKRSFICLCNKDSFFPPVSIFGGCGGGSCL